MVTKLLAELSGIGSKAVQDKFHVSTPMAETVWGKGNHENQRRKKERGTQNRRMGKGAGVL
jgi:hypothetical protein